MVGFVPLCDRSRLQNAAQSTNGGFLNAVMQHNRCDRTASLGRSPGSPCLLCAHCASSSATQHQVIRALSGNLVLRSIGIRYGVPRRSSRPFADLRGRCSEWQQGAHSARCCAAFERKECGAIRTFGECALRVFLPPSGPSVRVYSGAPHHWAYRLHCAD